MSSATITTIQQLADEAVQFAKDNETCHLDDWIHTNIGPNGEAVVDTRCAIAYLLTQEIANGMFDEDAWRQALGDPPTLTADERALTAWADDFFADNPLAAAVAARTFIACLGWDNGPLRNGLAVRAVNMVAMWGRVSYRPDPGYVRKVHDSRSGRLVPVTELVN